LAEMNRFVSQKSVHCINYHSVCGFCHICSWPGAVRRRVERSPKAGDKGWFPRACLETVSEHWCLPVSH